MTSFHYAECRQLRQSFIEENIGDGEIIDSFVVDRGHPGGAELHSVTDTGLIIITSVETGVLITELIARPEQLRRLYRLENREPPKRLLRRAYKHNYERYNEQ